ncbi:FRG domain-containing protein [Neptuniibacter sp. QD72_48]|uniref:FRG domain-containing protein n=1 Tax=Neptuniibacter sp. QD72_48 TaxID=3398214 RepID=UPI0039F53D43
MNKQWLGHINGTNTGNIQFNLDYVDSSYEGTLRIRDDHQDIPSIVANIEASFVEDTFSFKGNNIRALDDENYLELSSEQLSRSYPDAKLPLVIEGQGVVDGDVVKGEWKTDIATAGGFDVKAYSGSAEETIVQDTTWADFKNVLSNYGMDDYIFRGQNSNKWGLRTSYHRHGRSDLQRYFKYDVPKLYRLVHAETGLKFNLDDNSDLGALLYLAQHYGYPTPLLDWSCSPYVAAYFAFKGVDEAEENAKVRIYVLNKKEWESDTFQTDQYETFHTTVSYSELLASGNKRAIPQQAVTTFSTVDWIEGYFAYVSGLRSKVYLHAFDIDAHEKGAVLCDLRRMGITEASLFPGLVGICSDLKERYF